MIQEVLQETCRVVEDNYEIDTQPTLYGTCWLNENEQRKLHKDVYKIELNSLYPNVLMQLYENNIVTLDENDYKRMKYFINNRKEFLDEHTIEEYTQEKVWVNSYYGRLYRSQPMIAYYITEYVNQFHKFLLKKWEDNIIYIDVDTIIVKDNLTSIKWDVEDLKIPFDIEDVKHYYLKSKKRYAYNIGNQIVVKGFRDRDIVQYEELKNLIVREVRNDKLDDLLEWV